MMQEESTREVLEKTFPVWDRSSLISRNYSALVVELEQLYQESTRAQNTLKSITNSLLVLVQSLREQE